MQNTSKVPFQISTDCPAILAPTASCTVTLTVVASNNAVFAATLDAGGPASTLTGVSAIASDFAPTFAWTGDGTFFLDGSIATPATAQRTFTLTNTGTLTGVPVAPNVSGAGAGYAFSLLSHNCGVSLSVGATCTATVRATYTNNVASATETLASGTASQALTGSASGFAAAWAFDDSPSGIFTIVALATTSTQTFTLRNTGTLGGVVPERMISGPNTSHLEITGGTCASQTLAPNATCTVQVTFTASANVADRTATLSAGSATRALSGSASGFVLPTWRFVARVGIWVGCNDVTMEGETSLINNATPFCSSPTFQQFPLGGIGFSIEANTSISCPSVGATCQRRGGAGNCLFGTRLYDAFRCQ